jgi:mRNA-degrading endonuclease RelE of RelBE toxin-antitoxin system
VLEFIEFPAFTTRLYLLARDNADEVLLEIESDLLENPKRGAVVRETAGVRKARVSDPSRGKGKSGGFRYLYYYIEEDDQIFLLLIYSKDEQADLSNEQKKALARGIRLLRSAK